MSSYNFSPNKFFKNFIYSVFVLFLILNTTCASYQAGVTYEKENINTTGFYLSGTGEYYESNFIFFPEEFNETLVIGYDLNLKVPFYFFNDLLTLYPMAGFEGRYFSDFNYGFKFGGGLDISLFPAFFLRGTILNQPELTTYMDGYPGIRLNASIGFRTNDDPVRRRMERYNRTRENQRREEARRQEQANRRQEEIRREEDRVQGLHRAVRNNPNDPKARFDLASHFIIQEKYVLAAAEYEMLVQIDPNYRLSQTNGWTWSTSTSASFGISTTETIRINNFSAYLILGACHLDSAKNGIDREKFVPESERRNAYEKALAAYRRGFEIDITNRRNTDRNLHIMYLASIAFTLDKLGRTAEATATYIELSRLITLTDNMAFRVTSATRTGQSLFVSARGNDNNDGLSEARALRSLSVAYQRASAGTIRRIIVIGTLNHQSEGAIIDDYVFLLSAGEGVTNNNEILITGQWGSERAVLSGIGSRKSVVAVIANTRFEHIEISGGELNANNSGGNGIFIGRGVIGPGTVVRANKGSGLFIAVECTLNGGDIRDNENGGVTIFGTFNMQSGTIRNNRSSFGGGVFLRDGTFNLSGGTISNNSATEGGGGVAVELGKTFTMTGGTISNNRAAAGGGVASSGVFNQSGGTITGNSARGAGGVWVGHNSTYNRTGGTVSNNTATSYNPDELPGSNANVTRMPGSQGSGR